MDYLGNVVEEVGNLARGSRTYRLLHLLLKCAYGSTVAASIYTEGEGKGEGSDSPFSNVSLDGSVSNISYGDIAHSLPENECEYEGEEGEGEGKGMKV